MDRSTVSFIVFGRKIINGQWRISDLPVNRLYFVHGGSGFYIKNGERYAFERNHIYLFSANQDIKFESDIYDPVDHTYFDFIMYPGFVMEKEFKVSFDENPVIESAVEALCQIIKKVGDIYKADDAEKAIVESYFKSVLYFLNEIRPFEFVSDDRINKAVLFIHKNYSKELSVREIAASVFMETNHFIKVFKKHMNFSPYQYIKDYRFSVAFGMLRKGMKVTDVARHTGFMSVSAFSNAYKKKFGVYPGTVYFAEK